LHERRFHADIESLRSPERLALMEVEKVVGLCLEGILAQNVLDVGTGSGIFAEAFATRGLAVAGIDANPEMVKTAKGYVPQAEFKLAPAEAVPYPDKSFDLVFLGHVLHETDDALQALQEARRVARQRVAVFEWPYLDEQFGPPLAHRLKPETVRDLTRQAGFEEFEGVPLEHMAFYRLK
jgi:ubiquinone/menaquinone biosynthesis C-methylase UbiE